MDKREPHSGRFVKNDPAAFRLENSWPDKLRQVAEWLDSVNPIIFYVINLPLYSDMVGKESTELIVNSHILQNDLRELADLLEKDPNYQK